eukprot:scaffold6.g2674.t1
MQSAACVNKMQLGAAARQPTAFGQRRPAARPMAATRRVTSMKASMQFIKGINEPVVPNVRMTRSRDGSSGTATFTFDNPSIFEASSELGDITGLYMLDDEGVLETAKFVNGKPARIEAKYIMRSGMEFDRFMRFMERYSQAKGLEFRKA